MEHFSFKDLLKVFISGKITTEDFLRFKKAVAGFSDKELNEIIQSTWDEFESVPSMDKKIKANVLSDIHRKIEACDKRRPFSWLKIAAVVLFTILIPLSSYLYVSNTHKAEKKPEEFIIMAEGGHKTRILLPDGTNVWLNSNSTLSYSSDFNQNNRSVKLRGEAFFEVRNNSESRFTVGVESVNVIVHGTSFNVSAYGEDSTINVSLLEGRVHLENSLNNTSLMKLYPNQIAYVSKEDLVWKVRPCDAETERLWTQNKLKFENAQAKEVFRKLERWYGVAISVENMNEQVLYGFTLKSESLREILYEINKITPIMYTVNGEQVNITYK